MNLTIDPPTPDTDPVTFARDHVVISKVALARIRELFIAVGGDPRLLLDIQVTTLVTEE